MSKVTPEELDTLLEHGWRRFGVCYFRPVCGGCFECVSLRIPVAGFRPSKSQRRALKRCSHLRAAIGPPILDETRLDLYHAWHKMRENHRSWQPSPMTLEDYHNTFCHPHPCAREIAYYDGDRLVAIGLIDETPTSFSSIYFFYHPDCRPWGLGVASILFELSLAEQRSCEFLYLGYRIAGCPSTEYKAHFGPHQLLIGRPELTDTPMWVDAPELST